MSSQIRDTELRTNNIIDLRPSLEVRYDISDEKQKVTKVERYCDSCIKKLYAREPVL